MRIGQYYAMTFFLLYCVFETQAGCDFIASVRSAPLPLAVICVIAFVMFWSVATPFLFDSIDAAVSHWWSHRNDK